MAPDTEEKAGAARKLCEQGLWPEVLAFAQDWHAQNPADHKAFYYAGLGFAGMGQFPHAETAYRRALALDASDARVWNNLAGLLYENMQCQAEGIRCIKQALKLNPANQVGWANLATMVGRLGHHEQAMTYANRALALDSKLVEAYLHKGYAAHALGRTEIVREVCEALATIEPEKFRRAR